MLKKVNVFIFIFCLLSIISLTSCKKTYNVVFKDYDGEILKEEMVSEGQNATAPVNPSRDGYKFIGWDNEFTNISKDTVLIAQYELITQEDMNKEYTVTFKNSDGSVIKIEKVKYGQNATEPEMEIKDNMAFIGWDNSFLNVKEDVVLVANYLEVTEGLEYELNEEGYYELVGFGDVTVKDIVVSSVHNEIKVVGISKIKSNTSVRTITIPHGITYLEDSCFSGTRLKTVNMPSTVNEIGKYAFFNTTSSIFNLNVDQNNNVYKSIDNVIYSYDLSVLYAAVYVGEPRILNIPDSVKEIAPCAFCNTKNIDEIYIGNGVIKIGEYAFEGCEFLKKIEMGKNVEYIGKSAFVGCKNLDEITIPEKVKVIEESTFNGCNIAKLVISKGVEEIKENAFFECKYLKEIIVDEENKFFTSVDGVLFTKDMKKLIKYPGASLTKIYTIPEGVETVCVSAFQNTYLLRTVNFSSTVKSIEKNAFSGLQALESVMLNDGLETIGMNAFNASSDMIEIFIPKSVTHIETNAFGRCRSLTIYCEADSILDTWSESWNPLNRPVVWGYTK